MRGGCLDHAMAEPYLLPLFFLCCRLGEEQHCLIMLAHHGVADQLSLGIMKQDLSALYNGIVSSQDPQLAELTVQDSDYMAWLQQQEQRGAFASSQAYWREHFAAQSAGAIAFPWRDPFTFGQRGAELAVPT